MLSTDVRYSAAHQRRVVSVVKRAVFNNGSRPRVALTLSDGRYVVLPEAKSGSGARYANPKESCVFWDKGRTAFVVERGKTTYAGCEKQGGS